MEKLVQPAKNESLYRSADSGSANQYRIDVFARSVREVVTGAGGWIVDRVLAGWIVTVITDAADDAERAGRILGCEVTFRSAEADSARPRPYGIALSSALYSTDAQLQRCVTDAFDHEIVEVSLIGARPSCPSDPRLRPVTYRPSAAAVAFKAHSLAAAGIPVSSVAITERFRSAVLTGDEDEQSRRVTRHLLTDDGVAASSYR
ncbi:hypothetical protein BST36_24130 [Mycolicibacterium moriokaense]|jgi:hypothetical protein|uniref:Uncharacterized protein n=1 Tax=Mycolicibacterium moriokaense TaxID=39691 RepID=A0AAD1H8W4_9MYCO|nr:hypothetical protein BST36_24130 [Mycolicibacterium moriokaense]BBX01018.1 hypothetical protein MMOR_19540 [Mycolicibacterium moriokaense]